MDNKLRILNFKRDAVNAGATSYELNDEYISVTFKADKLHIMNCNEKYTYEDFLNKVLDYLNYTPFLSIKQHSVEILFDKNKAQLKNIGNGEYELQPYTGIFYNPDVDITFMVKVNKSSELWFETLRRFSEIFRNKNVVFLKNYLKNTDFINLDISIDKDKVKISHYTEDYDVLDEIHLARQSLNDFNEGVDVSITIDSFNGTYAYDYIDTIIETLKYAKENMEFKGYK